MEDRYGRKLPKHLHGTINLDRYTSSYKLMCDALLRFYHSHINHALTIRRIQLNATQIRSDDDIPMTYKQLSLFDEEKIEVDLSKEKKIEGISECRDESDRKDRVRVVIELKRDARPQVVLNQLFKHTQMQTTFGIIMLALVNGEPKILTLRECLNCFIDHRKDVILRRTKFELDKALARAHILEGLRIAIDYIDEVIQIIRSSYDDARERLMERFGLSEIQAQAILDMRLKTLSGLQREKIEEEYKQLMELIEHLRAILASEKLVFDIIKEELLEIKDKFGDERKTKIVAAEGEIDVEDLIKEEQCVVALTHFG